MPSIITTAAAFARFEDEIKPAVIAQYGADDTVALSEAWNDYSDSLCKGGELNDLQYNYAPAYDDDMPGDSWDEELSHLLESLGVTVTATRIEKRPDGLCDGGYTTRHFEIVVTRGDKTFTTYYSQGSAYTTDPDASDVFGSLLKDMTDDTSGDFESDFKDWAENLGYDTDSRSAERIYRACLAIDANLRAMFTNAQDLDDLREVANEI